MPKFCVRFYEASTIFTRCDITVEAADEAAARQRVLDGFSNEGDLELTDEELDTKTWGKEFPDDCPTFSHLENLDQPFAVCEVV